MVRPQCSIDPRGTGSSQRVCKPLVPQRRSEIEPDRVLDNRGREAMTAVAERSHLGILSNTPLSRPGFRDGARRTYHPFL